MKPPDQIPNTPRWEYMRSEAGQLEWAIAEKHAAQADAEREKATADTLRLRVAELESEIRGLRWLLVPPPQPNDSGVGIAVQSTRPIVTGLILA